MLSDEALQALAGELWEMLEPKEFDSACFYLTDHSTALILKVYRGERHISYKFKSAYEPDLDEALACIRGYFRRREIN